MSKKPRHDWEKIRTLYQTSPSTLSNKDFAKKMGVSVRSPQTRMKQDRENGLPWERDLADEVKNKTKQMQQRIAAGLGADVPVTDEALAVATAAATNVMVLERHEKAFDEALKAITDGIQLTREQILNGFVVIKRRRKDGNVEFDAEDVDGRFVGQAMKSLTGSLKDVVTMQRHHLGLDDNESDTSYLDDIDALEADIEREEKELAMNGDIEAND